MRARQGARKEMEADNQASKEYRPLHAQTPHTYEEKKIEYMEC